MESFVTGTKLSSKDQGINLAFICGYLRGAACAIQHECTVADDRTIANDWGKSSASSDQDRASNLREALLRLPMAQPTNKG